MSPGGSDSKKTRDMDLPGFGSQGPVQFDLTREDVEMEGAGGVGAFDERTGPSRVPGPTCAPSKGGQHDEQDRFRWPSSGIS